VERPPNGRLVAEVSGLAPGRALDVGCGEGADAIWLARQGWAVTAVDISDVAIGRGRQAGRSAQVDVEWLVADVLEQPPARGAFDLVSLQYPALPKAAGEASLLALLAAVRPGGVLLVVHHEFDDAHRAHTNERGVDPDDYFSVDDVERLLGDDFDVQQRVVEPRLDPPPGNPHIADDVLRARRR